MKTLTKKNLLVALLAFGLISIALSSCDRHHCPTYSTNHEKPIDHQA